MNEKIIEILIQLLGHLKDHDLDIESLGEFTDGLVTRGYDESEVTEAIHWFIEKMNSRSVMSTEIEEQTPGSVRVLHESERINISPDIYGYLLQLKALDIITGAQMEKILDYYMLLGSNSMKDIDINEIIASILFENY